MKKIVETRSWYNVYKERVGSEESLTEFRSKYSLFLEVVKSLSIGGMIKEEGIGIGGVSKSLIRLGIPDNKLYGSDICKKMITLCQINLDNRVKVFHEDIFSTSKKYTDSTTVVCTHGVLEHFTDKQISSVIHGYTNKCIFSVHYVPTDFYPEPSFGDERLLPKEHWIRTFKPFYHYTDNDSKDLYLIFKHR